MGKGLRVELEKSDIPYEFPDTTTGAQALAYIRNVWKVARSSPEGLASKVRDVLPAAYAYCLEDRADDTAFFEQWRAAMPEAAVFAERERILLEANNDVYFDDLDDRRFFPENMRLRTVTGGHLGNSRPARLRTAKALGLRLLSSSIELKWREGDTLRVGDDWVFRFDVICQLLRRVRRSERAENDETGAETGIELRLIRVHELILEICNGNAPAEHVPVNARLNDDVLTVADRPVQFGSDAAKELLRHFSFVQRGDLAADLTRMLGAIDDRSNFILAADKFRRSFVPDIELPAIFQCASSAGEVATLGRDGPSPPGGPYTKPRALAQPDALAKKLRSVLKGELVPSDDNDEPIEAMRTNGNSGTDLGDEEYREAVMQYERESGREPVVGDPHQTGWDIRSADPKTGKIVRLIEVKGKGRPWDGDEVVELSRAQIREAFAASADGTPEWYLYVVEKTDDGHHVLPVANPVRVAAKWILCGGSWRVVAGAEIRRDASRSDRSG